MANRSAGKVSLSVRALSRWASSPWATRLARRLSNDAIQDAALAVLEREHAGQLTLESSGTADSFDMRLGGYLMRSAQRAHASQRRQANRAIYLPDAGVNEESSDRDLEEVLDARRSLEWLPCSAEEVRLLASRELVDETDNQQAERLGLTLNTLQARRSRIRKRLGTLCSARSSR